MVAEGKTIRELSSFDLPIASLTLHGRVNRRWKRITRLMRLDECIISANNDEQSWDIERRTCKARWVASANVPPRYLAYHNRSRGQRSSPMSGDRTRDTTEIKRRMPIASANAIAARGLPRESPMQFSDSAGMAPCSGNFNSNNCVPRNTLPAVLRRGKGAFRCALSVYYVYALRAIGLVNGKIISGGVKKKIVLVWARAKGF